MARNLAWLLALPVLALGCVRYRPAPLDLASTARELQGRSLHDPGLKAYMESCEGGTGSAQPRASWSFDQLTDAALYFSPVIKGAEAEVLGAEADAFAAGLRPDPTLSASAEYRYSGSQGPPSTWGPSLDIPITTAGKRGIRQAEAGARLRERRLKLDECAWRVRSLLRSALLDRDSAAGRAAALERLEASRKESLRLMEARLAAGEASQPEVETARAEAEQAAMQLAQARGALREAVARLAEAVGVPQEALAEVRVEPLPAEFPDDPAGPDARAKALTARTDLLASVAAYGAAEQALRLAVAEQVPDLHLSPGLLFDQGAKAWVLGAAAVLPLLNRNRGGIAQAKAQREIEGRRVLALQEAVLHEWETAQAGYEAFLEALARARAQEEARTAALDAADAALRAGEGDRLAVVLARAGLDSACVDRLAAAAQAQAALGRIEDALQTPILPAVPLPPLPETEAAARREETSHEK